MIRPGYGFFSLWIHAKLRIPRERVSLIDAKNAHNHGMAMKTDRVMVAYIRTFFFRIVTSGAHGRDRIEHSSIGQILAQHMLITTVVDEYSPMMDMSHGGCYGVCVWRAPDRNLGVEGMEMGV